MKISRLGEAPDYRFSLANERTFLAWIRTAGVVVVSVFRRVSDVWLLALVTQ